MLRSGLLFALFVIVLALCAGFLPSPAAAGALPFTTLDALSGGHGADALLSATGDGPLCIPAPRGCASLAGLASSAVPSPSLPPASRALLPSPVRTAHRVDGLSLPLLR